MANHLLHVLDRWYSERDSSQWVLGTVYRTEGPCYRKTGAMMLFGSLGQQLGMLSGGCLESDIQRHARKVMDTSKAVTLCYDALDEDDLTFQLGIGCGGKVEILLQPVNADLEYLALDQVYLHLKNQQQGIYYQRIPSQSGEVDSYFQAVDCSSSTAKCISEGEQMWLATPVAPPVHLLILGGGIDARPLVDIAYSLGWTTTLWDPRPSNARREYFLSASNILDVPGSDLEASIQNLSIDTAVIMTHSIELDAVALQAVNTIELGYLALLGPRHRRQQVLEAAGLNEVDMKTPIAGPAGLDIGADLPESIALSILAECHAKLRNRPAISMCDILPATGRIS